MAIEHDIIATTKKTKKKKEKKRNDIGNESYKYKGIELTDEDDFEKSRISHSELHSINLDDSIKSVKYLISNNDSTYRIVYWLRVGPLVIIGIIITLLEIAVIVMMIMGLTAVLQMKSTTISNIGKSTSKSGLKGCITISSEGHNNNSTILMPPLPPYNLQQTCSRRNKRQCRKLCHPASCCFASNNDNCHNTFPERCVDYKACNVLYNDQKDEIKLFLDAICALDRISSKDGRSICESVCEPAKCCYTNCFTTIQCKYYESCEILGITDQIKKIEKEKLENDSNETFQDNYNEKFYDTLGQENNTYVMESNND